MLFVRQKEAALWHVVERSYHWIGEVRHSTVCGRDIYLLEHDLINLKRVKRGSSSKTNTCTQCASLKAKQLAQIKERPSNKPFTKDDILYHIFLTKREQKNKFFIFRPKQIVLTTQTIFVESVNGIWKDGGVPHALVLIERLLADLNELRHYIGAPGGPSYEELVRENDRLAAFISLQALGEQK